VVVTQRFLMRKPWRICARTVAKSSLPNCLPQSGRRYFSGNAVGVAERRRRLDSRTCSRNAGAAHRSGPNFASYPEEELDMIVWTLPRSGSLAA